MDYVVIIHPERALYWLAAIAVSAALAIGASTRGWRRGVYCFKPLTTLLILGLALTQPADAYLDFVYRPLIVGGLVCSLAGDVLLMLPRDRFVAGLVAFLIAHLLYIGAFTFDAVRATWWIVLPLAAYAVVLLRILLPHVAARLRVPVIVYALVLLAMAWAAAERGVAGMPGGALAAAGALLFVASDSALAINRFARQFRGADAVVLGTYYAAQTLIALSAGILGRILFR
ncbi:MAG TPA: lysoplasmalogenase [Longimicrobium sp.]|nr:lysoplasmalogenase [Longimicrobium sp.]